MMVDGAEKRQCSGDKAGSFYLLEFASGGWIWDIIKGNRKGEKQN